MKDKNEIITQKLTITLNNLFGVCMYKYRIRAIRECFGYCQCTLTNDGSIIADFFSFTNLNKSMKNITENK